MFELHQHQMIGKPAKADARGRDAPVQRDEGHQQQPAGIKPCLGEDGQFAVSHKFTVVTVPEQHKPVVKRAVKHMLAHVTPMGGRCGHLEVGQRQRLLHLRHGQVHQPRITIGAAPLVGDPIGPHIAFLKDMHPQPRRLRLCHGNRMDRAGIAVKHDIGDVMGVDQVGKSVRPILNGAAKRDIPRCAEPERAVACVKSDPPDVTARGAQHFGKPMEKGPMGSLQKHKASGGRVGHVAGISQNGQHILIAHPFGRIKAVDGQGAPAMS